MLKNRIMMMMIMYMLSVAIDLHACLTTLINDEVKKIIIYNKVDKTLVPIQRNEKRRFGNQHQHAHFAIYTQLPNRQVFSRLYTCKQNTCGSSGNIQLKLSDIENSIGAAQLFTITKSKSHASMVEELPMVQKRHCRSCGDE